MGCHYLKNWKADKVRDFAKYKRFRYSHTNGDDEYWVNNDRTAIFRIPVRNEDIPEKTMYDMVRKSKVSKSEWIKWGQTN